MKKYEIALLYGSYEYEDVETFEYETLLETKNDLQYFIENHRENLYKIEISILEQDESGENENYFIVAEIDIKNIEFVKSYFLSLKGATK